MANSPHDMMAAVTGSMRERTGRDLDEWVALVQRSGIDPLEQNAVRRWLKSEHGVLLNSQWAIADAAARAAGWVRPEIEDYVDQQYDETRAGLRPIFDRLREFAESLGEDVTIEGRSTYTPFVRRRQFMAIAAATRTRIDLGLRFTAAPEAPLIGPAKAPGQATHKLCLTSETEVTREVLDLIRAAYEQNG